MDSRQDDRDQPQELQAASEDAPPSAGANMRDPPRQHPDANAPRFNGTVPSPSARDRKDMLSLVQMISTGAVEAGNGEAIIKEALGLIEESLRRYREPFALRLCDLSDEVLEKVFARLNDVRSCGAMALTCRRTRRLVEGNSVLWARLHERHSPDIGALGLAFSAEEIRRIMRPLFDSDAEFHRWIVHSALRELLPCVHGDNKGGECRGEDAFAGGMVQDAKSTFGTHRGGVLHGKGIEISRCDGVPNRIDRMGVFSDGQLHGSGIARSSSGHTWEGHFNEGSRDGICVYRFPGGSVMEGPWLRGYIHGPMVMRGEDTTVSCAFDMNEQVGVTEAVFVRDGSQTVGHSDCHVSYAHNGRHWDGFHATSHSDGTIYVRNGCPCGRAGCDRVVKGDTYGVRIDPDGTLHFGVMTKGALSRTILKGTPDGALFLDPMWPSRGDAKLYKLPDRFSLRARRGGVSDVSTEG